MLLSLLELFVLKKLIKELSGCSWNEDWSLFLPETFKLWSCEYKFLPSGGVKTMESSFKFKFYRLPGYPLRSSMRILLWPFWPMDCLLWSVLFLWVCEPWPRKLPAAGAVPGMNEVPDSRFLRSMVSDCLLLSPFLDSFSLMVIFNIPGVFKLAPLAVVPLCENGPLILDIGNPIEDEPIWLWVK